MASRWAFYPTIGVLVAASLAAFAASSIEWSDRTAMVGDNPAEAAEQAQIASQLLAIGVVNILATLLRVLRTRWAWTAVLGIQVGIFALALWRGFAGDGDIGWFEFSALPVATASLLIWARFAKPLVQGRLAAS